LEGFLSAVVLVVDDDPHIAEVVDFALTAAGYQVLSASSAEEAWPTFQQSSPDLAIVDINLPGKDGLWLCRTIREISQVPILFLSARDEEVDTVMGLTIGGDDYVTKPFSPRELTARVGAILRRQKAPTSQTFTEAPKENEDNITKGPLRLDLESITAFWLEQKVDLTATEFRLLKTLCQRPRKVFSREELLTLVFPGVAVSDRTIDSHILHIRKKFFKAGAKEIIQTQHGLGYSLAEL
jgi:two-component system OmpR family response regulator